MGYCWPFLSKGSTHPGALRRASLPRSASSFVSLDKGTGNETISPKTRPKNQLVSIWFSKTWNLFTEPGRAPSWACERPICECLGNWCIPLQVSCCLFQNQKQPGSQEEMGWATSTFLMFFKILIKKWGETIGAWFSHWYCCFCRVLAASVTLSKI